MVDRFETPRDLPVWYNSHMATFTLYLPDSLLVRLDEAREGESRSSVVRRALEEELETQYPPPEPTPEKPPRSPEEGYVSPFVGKGAKKSSLKDVL